MARKIKPATDRDFFLIRCACELLCNAREKLAQAGASKRCVDRVRRAITSARGAERHVCHRIGRTPRP